MTLRGQRRKISLHQNPKTTLDMDGPNSKAPRRPYPTASKAIIFVPISLNFLRPMESRFNPTSPFAILDMRHDVGKFSLDKTPTIITTRRRRRM